MKDRRMWLYLLLSAALWLGTSRAAENPVHFLGAGGNYQWSPGGTYLSFIRGGQLLLYVVAGDSVADVGKAPYWQYAWLNDSGLVFNYSDKPKRDSVGVATLKYLKLRFGGLAPLVVDSVVKVDYRAAHAARLLSDSKGSVRLQTSVEGPHAVVADPKGWARRATPAYGGADYNNWGDVWLTDTEGRRAKQVTHRRELILPQFCPARVLVSAADARGHILIFDSTGGLIADAGLGGCEIFSNDCSGVYYVTEVDSESDIVGGDVFHFSLADSVLTQLTFSPNRPELYPKPSPDNGLLVYQIHGNEGGIEVMFLKGGK